MTQKEFETLTGKEVTAEEYQNIEAVYMADKGMDKVAFCEMWVNTPKAAQKMMIEMAVNEQRVKNDAKVAVQSLLNEKKHLLDVMFESVQRMSDPELRKECIKQMGAKEYCKKLLEGGYKLWEDDKQLMIEIFDNIN